MGGAVLVKNGEAKTSVRWLTLAGVYVNHVNIIFAKSMQACRSCLLQLAWTNPGSKRSLLTLQKHA